MEAQLYRTRFRLIIFLAVSLLSVNTMAAATLTVTNTDDSGAGSVRDAIANASNGDTILFSLTGCPCTLTLTSGGFVVDKNLTLSGPGAEQLTISANSSFPFVFQIQAGAT